MTYRLHSLTICSLLDIVYTHSKFHFFSIYYLLLQSVDCNIKYILTSLINKYMKQFFTAYCFLSAKYIFGNCKSFELYKIDDFTIFSIHCISVIFCRGKITLFSYSKVVQKFLKSIENGIIFCSLHSGLVLN